MVDRPVLKLDSFSTTKYPDPMPKTSLSPPQVSLIRFNLVLVSECWVKCQVESVVCCSHRLRTRGLCSFGRLQ